MKHDSLNIQDAIEESKNTLNWVANELNGLKIPNLPPNRRMQMAVACQHLSIEHAQSIIVLIDNELYGSALALQRPLFEACTRGVWLWHSATDEEIVHAMQDKFPSFGEMAERVSLSDNPEGKPPLKILKDRWWSYLCGYTHTGSQQIFSRLGEIGFCSNYERDQIIAALRWADLVQLYSSLMIALAIDNRPLAEKFLRRMDTYEGTPYQEA